MKKTQGFTLIELMVVIAIIAILAGIILPISGYAIRKAKIAKTVTTLKQLSVAVESYRGSGEYPRLAAAPSAGFFEESQTFAFGGGKKLQYRVDVLLPLLDGDKSNGGPATQYFEFNPNQIDQEPGRDNVYLDAFGSPYYYCDVEREQLDQKYAAANANNFPLHPHYHIINFKTFQMYSKIDLETNAYGENTVGRDTFQWPTNYN